MHSVHHSRDSHVPHAAHSAHAAPTPHGSHSNHSPNLNTSTNFADLHLAEPLLKALIDEGYTVPTPIQAQAIPHVLKGVDVLGCAQTGTGKTAAFALPILQRLMSRTAGKSAGAADTHVAHETHRDTQHRAAGTAAVQGYRPVRCLVLCPTRELASQIGESFRTYGKGLHLRSAVIFGGVGMGAQIESFRRGVDIVVATPGRLMDHMRQRYADLSHVEVLVLDEADRMLDMGFIHDIRRIVTALPAKRQNLLFSATMPPEIRKLADTILRHPVTVHVAPPSTTAERIEQSVYFVQKSDKTALLAHLVENAPMTRALVFTRTKHGADRVVRSLRQYGINAEAIHGNKSQNARQRALANFKSEKTPVLVATDIASRGIDIDDISHVVNYDLSHEPETYVHRIGRTARAGAAGAAVSFCDHDERGNLKAIERLIRISIPVKTDHPQYSKPPAAELALPEQQEEREHAPRHGGRDGHRTGARRGAGAGRASHPARAAHATHATHKPHVGHGSQGSHGSHARSDGQSHARTAGKSSQHSQHSHGKHPSQQRRQDGPRPAGRGVGRGAGNHSRRASW